MGFKPIKVDCQLVYRDLWFSTWDSDIEHLSEWLPMDDLTNQVRFIETYAKPYFEPARHPQHVRSQYWMKESLRYCLNIYDETIEAEILHDWESGLSNYKLPTDIYAFLLRVWQILFPEESWVIDDLSFYHDIGAEARAQAQTKRKGAVQPDPLATPRSSRRRKRHEVVRVRQLPLDPDAFDSDQ
jgi:hypothetical protein